jgi:ABC-2 type transport system permease protein
MKRFTRVGAVIRKELLEIIRRPGALLSLALGPLAVMALFGLGFTGTRGPVDVIVVIPKEIQVSRDVEMYQKVAGGMTRIVEITDDVQRARARLASGEIDIVVIAPADYRQKLESGEQAVVVAETDQLDPLRQGINATVADIMTRELNAEVIRLAAAEGQARLVQTTGQATATIKPEIVARPFRVDIRNTAGLDPTLLIFFTPAVLALVLQHLGVTLTALSMIRERLSGAVDIFRVAPISAVELLVGKYVAYAILGLAVATVVVLATTNGLHLPFVGSVASFGLAVILLTFASLGLGLLISLVADSERQAVQLSMLVLLASMFFSGFVLPVHEFREPVRSLAYLLPVTYGIEIFQQEMLRGSLRAQWMQAALALIGTVLFMLSAARMRGVLRGVR